MSRVPGAHFSLVETFRVGCMLFPACRASGPKWSHPFIFFPLTLAFDSMVYSQDCSAHPSALSSQGQRYRNTDPFTSIPGTEWSALLCGWNKSVELGTGPGSQWRSQHLCSLEPGNALELKCNGNIDIHQQVVCLKYYKVMKLVPILNYLLCLFYVYTIKSCLIWLHVLEHHSPWWSQQWDALSCKKLRIWEGEGRKDQRRWEDGDRF